MAEDVSEIFAVVIEGGKQGPILMEMEAGSTSREHALKRLHELLKQPNWFRGCIVRLEYVDGNKSVLHAMKAAEGPAPEKWWI